MHYLLIGRLIKPYGLKGEIKTAFYVDDLKELAAFSRYYIPDPKVKGSYLPIQFENIRLHHDQVVVTVAGCNDRNGSELYQGKDLFVDEAELPSLKKDTYYIKDLLNLSVENQSGKVGVINNLIDIANKTMLVVRLLDGKELVIPFTGEYVDSVELSNSRVVVKNIEKLL